MYFLKVQGQGHRNFSPAPRGRLLCFSRYSTLNVPGVCVWVEGIAVAMIRGQAASRSRLYSAPVAPGSYYESQRVRPGHFCGSTAGKNGSKTSPTGAGLTIGLQEVVDHCEERRMTTAATVTVLCTKQRASSKPQLRPTLHSSPLPHNEGRSLKQV